MATLADLHRLKQQGQKISCLTAYDAGFARLLEGCGIDVILVGDSLGMVVQGHDSTIPVTLDDMVYHTRLVRRGAPQTWIIADLPFMTTASLSSCLTAAQHLLQQGGAHMVKLEGGEEIAPLIAALTQLGVPVCAHLGLLPQQALRLGYRRRGHDQDEALRLRDAAKTLVDAGASLLILECVEPQLAAEISQALPVPVIGIGSGAGTDGQVLVLSDVIGLSDKAPSFAPSFLTQGRDLPQAIRAYISAVKERQFPQE